MTKKKRAKDIEKAMRLVWSSLESHLEYTHTKHHDPASHHRKAIIEYCEILRILASCL